MRRPFLASLVLTVAIGATPAAASFPADPPNDPLFDASPLPNAANEQWDLASPGGGFDRGISADRAWPLSTGRGVTIADIDLGVQLDHPDLVGAWARGARDFYAYDGDPTSDTATAHGTNVAGVLAARADNGIGIAGIAPDARVLPLRSADNILHDGWRLAEAITYAADRGARVMSMSLGADSFPSSLRAAVAYAHRRGAVMAVASGNEFHFHHHVPQVLDDVLAVGGVNPDTATIRVQDGDFPTATGFTVHSPYADYGPHLDVVAPTQVPTTEWGGGYRKNWDGTSAAAPHVAGVAALVIARAKGVGLRLSADEVMQIIRMSADDLDDATQGYEPGWDPISGWGRVNAFRAVKMVTAKTIPPDANITAPDWYSPERRRFTVRGFVAGRSATHWRLELGRGTDPRRWRKIASGRGRGTKSRRLASLDPARLGRGGWTLRLRATDANGNRGEDRAYFTTVEDRSLRPGFPRRIGGRFRTSGEASPTLADLNGDGAKDIVLAGSDGVLRVLDGRTGRPLPGWPRHMRPAPFSSRTSRELGMAVRSGFLGTPAVGDIAGSDAPEVVAAGMDGRIYAWSAGGGPVKGFSYRIRQHAPADDGLTDGEIYSTPALADLDRNGKLDVLFGAADQRIYAIDGRGRDLPGWPVRARSVGPAKILSSAAVGDLNGDGRPDVVEGTAETAGSAPSMTGRVYAFDATGKPLPGWPISPGGLVTNGIPLAGQGVPMSPSLADVDGDGSDEVAVAAFTGEPELYSGDGTRLGGAGGQSRFEFEGRGVASNAGAPSVLALGANSAFGRLAKSGPLGYFGGQVDSRLAAAQTSPSVAIPFEHLMGGWNAETGAWIDGFPQVLEGWPILGAPAIADVGGGKGAEVIAGTSGDVLHAFGADGSEPSGWPKDTGGWLLAAPAVGDIDGDGRLEVVAVTRDGFLYAWDTPGRGRVEWGSFRHDPRNTGEYR